VEVKDPVIHQMHDSRICPVCESSTTIEFLTRASVPVHQHLLHEDAESARAISRGSLAMRACGDCGFGFNAAFEPDLLDYGDEYDNTQTYSEDFNTYTDGLVRDLVERHGIRNARVVEVGCGKGAFLKKLVLYPGANNTGLGFDPTYLGPDTDLSGRVRFFRRFYDDTAAILPADVVICRHVIEHIQFPLDLLRAVRAALSHSPDARVFFETPCLEWILRHQVVWDLFYEHCSLFTASSLTLALTRAGFTNISVKHVFRGQYLWLEGKVGLDSVSRARSSGEVITLAQAFQNQEPERVSIWQDQLRHYHSQGHVAVWGAGAKGVTYCNLIDPQQVLLSCVVDINPHKQGKCIAGTGHKIVGPEELQPFRVATVLVLNPNYQNEVCRKLRNLGLRTNPVDLMKAG
jgi:SAM-dependent methyltransferase